MSIESGGFNPESRGKIDYIKEQVRNSKVFELKDGPARDLAADQVLSSVGISGVDNLVDLMNKREDRNVNQEALADQIDYLGVAIGEVMMESGNEEMKQAVVAGSFSTERFLPKKWIIDGDKYTGDQSLARVIVDGIKSNSIKDSQKRVSVIRAMEIVDFYKNNPQYKETGLLESQIDISIGVLNGLLNPLNRKEMDFISGELVYLQGLKANTRNSVDSVSRDPTAATGRRRDQFRPRVNENGEIDGGVESAWQVSPDKLADSMKDMETVRWQSYTPPEWFKRLGFNPDGTVSKEGQLMQARIQYMIGLSDGSSYLLHVGKDLEKIRQNPAYKSFTNERMSQLFDGDFKLVFSKMLNDLCEIYEDQNHRPCLRYKEGRNSKGQDGIKASVEYKLKHIENYKDELAKFLAEQNGRSTPSFIDRMNAYSAWNLFYVFGDSSLCDRRRSLPTYTGIVVDAMRTLNPEFKAKSKWTIAKGGEVTPDSDFDEAEWFGGSLGNYVQTVMGIESKIGAIDKKTNKRLKDKIVDGTMPIFNYKTCYGFLDFNSGARDLYRSDGKNFYDKKTGSGAGVTLSTLLMNHASFDEDGKLIKVNESTNAWSFGDSEVDFLNWFRDQQESAEFIYQCTTGKSEVKNIDNFVSSLRTVLGMVNQIKYDGGIVLNYPNRVDLWANVILGTFGVDLQRLSSEHIRLKNTTGRAYSAFVNDFLMESLKLTNSDVNLRELMSYLGVSLKLGELPNSFTAETRNEIEWSKEKRRTDEIKRRVQKNVLS